MTLQTDKEKSIQEILSMIPNDSDLIIPLANGEPDYILTEIDRHPERFSSLRIHQMLELKDRKYMHNEYPQIRYISYFMGSHARNAYLNGTCDLIPNHFHQMPDLLRETAKKPIILCQAAPMDQNGYFSLGTEASYIADFIGEFPFILQVNKEMPYTYGKNKIHISQVLAYVRHDEPLAELNPPTITDKDRKIAQYIAERIDNGATLQIGIGGVPDAVVSLLKDHRDLGIHTEMLTDGIAELAKNGVITGARKKTNPGKIIASFAFGTKKLYDFIHLNKDIEFRPVNYTNDPRNIAKEDNIVSINATTEIDFYGQCASETIGGKYYSSTGGQADFAIGVQFAKNGKGFICTHSTAKNETISRIRPSLAPNSVVTTSKNDVEYVVTEYGVARLKGKSLSERTKALISLAHPKFREELLFEAKKMGILI